MFLGNIQSGVIKPELVPVPTSFCPHHFFSLRPPPSFSSVLHLSFPLCPSSPLLFITPLIKPAHPERTDFGAGWGREGREREAGSREMNEG